jgi:hypothetical protein
MKTFKRLGKDKPHQSAQSPMKGMKEEEEGVKRPLSPKEPVAGATQQTIDVNPDGVRDEEPKQETSVEVEEESKSIEQSVDDKALVRRTKLRIKREEDPSKPYLGLFSASILADATPPTIEITDLRDDVTGGDKVWTEQLSCLVCGTPIV